MFKREKNPGSRYINYDLMMQTVYDWLDVQKELLPLSETCKKHGFTVNRLHICKKKPLLGRNVLAKMKRAGINIDSFTI